MAHMTKELSNDEYRKVDAYSKSDLDLISLSPALIEWKRNAPSDGSEAVERGTDLHCSLLEPERFQSDYIRMPQYDLRTSSGRASADSFQASCKISGRKVMSTEDHKMVCDMRDSVLAHPASRNLLQQPGVSEPSIFWELDGIKLKARPDRMPEPDFMGHVLADVKKIADIDKIEQHIREFRYHVQAAFYSDAYRQLTGSKPRFIFIFVGEKRSIGQYPVRVMELSQEWLDAGRELYLADLEKVKEIIMFGDGLDIEVLPMRKNYY